MAWSEHVVAGARCVRVATLVLALVMVVAIAALCAFDARYGQGSPASLRIDSSGRTGP